MSNLFSPIRFGNLELPNRTVRSATWEGMADAMGYLQPALEELTAELARNRVGLIVCGYLHVEKRGRGLPGQTGIFRDEHVAGLSRMVAAAHRNGGRIAAQLAHAGGRTRVETIGGQVPMAPSAVDGFAFGQTPREMTNTDMAEVKEAFARAAGRAQAAGFDAIQLHAAHGYLLSQFLSPLYNFRTDRYGGSVENRCRFLIEVYEAVRNEVGSGYPILMKINSQDGPPGGLTVAEALEASRQLQDRGLAAVEVSGGLAGSTDLRPSRMHIRRVDQEAYFKSAAARFKAALDIPVILVGGIKSCETAEGVLESGAADAVAFSRALICEPDLISRWAAGDRRPSRCISCNRCLQEGLGGGIKCVGQTKRTSSR